MAVADRGDRGSRRPGGQLPRRVHAGAWAACSLAHLSEWEPLSESPCQAGTWDCFRCGRKPLMSPFWRSARSRSSRWRSSFLKGASPYCFELLAQSRVESAYFVVARRGKNASARSSSARRRAISDARSPFFGAARAIARGIRLLRRRSQRKNASAHSSSARRRAISDARSSFLELLAQSRVESAYFVVARRGKTPPLTPPQHGGARFTDARSSFLGAARAIARGVRLLRRRSQRKERLRSLLLSTAARDFPTLAAPF